MNRFFKDSEVILHWYFAGMAGFLGVFSLMLFAGNFGNAVTGNLILFSKDLAEGEYLNLLIRLGAFLAFGVGTSASYLMIKCTKWNYKLVAALVDAAALLATAAMSVNLSLILSIYPLLFATAFQWGVFGGAAGYSCATIFLSNNTRQTAIALTDYCMTKDPKAGEKAFFFGMTIAAFMLGALIGSVAILKLDRRAAWVGVALLAVAVVIILTADKSKK